MVLTRSQNVVACDTAVDCVRSDVNLDIESECAGALRVFRGADARSDHWGGASAYILDSQASAGKDPGVILIQVEQADLSLEHLDGGIEEVKPDGNAQEHAVSFSTFCKKVDLF